MKKKIVAGKTPRKQTPPKSKTKTEQVEVKMSKLANDIADGIQVGLQEFLNQYAPKFTKALENVAAAQKEMMAGQVTTTEEFDYFDVPLTGMKHSAPITPNMHGCALEMIQVIGGKPGAECKLMVDGACFVRFEASTVGLAPLWPQPVFEAEDQEISVQFDGDDANALVILRVRPVPEEQILRVQPLKDPVATDPKPEPVSDAAVAPTQPPTNIDL